MAPTAVFSNPATNPVANLKASVKTAEGVPATLNDLLLQATEMYPSHELSFITSSAHDSSVQARTFQDFNQRVRNLASALAAWKKPAGEVVVVYLTEHEDNMSAVWACLLAGLVPCLQPALSAQQEHKEGHIAHIRKLFGSATWLTNDAGAMQLDTIKGLDVHLFSDLLASAEKSSVAANYVARQSQPDDEAILFLTSGSTGFSKAVVHTHRTIINACIAKGANYRLTPQTNILNWVGFDHVAGSLEMHIAPLLYGCSQLHVHASAILSDPLLLLRLIDERSIDIAFAPNFLLAKMVRDLEKRTDLHGKFDLSSLRRMNSGGEAVVSKTAVAFVQLLKKLGRNPSKVSFKVAAGFGMTETCAGCIYDVVDLAENSPKHEFLALGAPVHGCEMRIVDPEDGATPRSDGQPGELQVRGPMIFVRYYNNPEATKSSFVEGGWYRTGDIGIIENGNMRLSGRIKDTVIVHGVSYGIPELETYLQTVQGVTHSFLAAAPYRAPGQETEGFVVFYAPTFDLQGDDASKKLSETHRAIKDVSVKMMTLPPQHIVPIPMDQMEKTTLGKLSRARLLSQFVQGALAKHVARAEELISMARGASFVTPSTDDEKALAAIYAGIFNLQSNEVSARDNFFELGGTSIDVIRLKREGEAHFGLSEIPIIQILKNPIVSDLAKYVNGLVNNDASANEYDPIVPLQLSGDKTPIFFVHPGVGEVLIFVNLAKYFQNERPFYAFRARGFEPGHPFFGSMDEMVTSYANAMKKTQPKGPYAIAGYSYGGVVAFEVAKRLESMGEEVKFVGLINIPPHIADRMHEIDWTGGMLNLAYFLSLVTKQDATDLHPKLKTMTKEEQLEVVWKLAPPERVTELQLTPGKLDHWVSIAGSLIECGKSYNPGGNVSAVDVFYAIPLKGSKEDWLNKQLKPWSQFSRGEPQFIDVPGQHYTLMDFDHVPQFQKIFRGRLEARGL
uniref:Atromentin synthetase n=1 Tax=Tapinella panuoides TaxID=80604 RepID=ATRA_TAPPA|nr:RecName: Full=Atromentin synthetase; AltName: Full=Atromentin biosynthesis protein A; AltName: Full=Nonribosomal peptide synthase atrA [Tapinella panuoides]ACH90386.1 atromentin synthetase [Tapinella panuoides]